jgi:DNA-binding NtrC family response regulator
VNLLSRILEPYPMSAFGMNIFGATSTEEARSTLELFVPDILVVDLDMKDIWTVLQCFRRDFPHVAIIAVTGSDQRAGLARKQGIENVLAASGDEDFIDSLLDMLGVEDKAAPRGPGILLVGGANDEIASLFAMLRHSGYDVRLSPTVTAARQMLESNPGIRLVMLDILVPGGGALSLIKEAGVRFPRVGAMVLTSVLDSEVVRLALRLGAFECLIQPLEGDRVIHSIEACLAHVEYQAHRPWWKRIWEDTA